MNKYDNLRLFSNCKLVKGINRSVIYDLQRSQYLFISNTLYDILQSLNDSLPLEKIKSTFDQEGQRLIDQYISFFIENDILFHYEKDGINNFPEISTKYFSPKIIDNCIIDIDAGSNHDYEKIFSELSKYIPTTIQLRFLHIFNKEYLINILNLINYYDIKTVQIIIPYKDDFFINYLETLASNFTRITLVVIYNSPKSYSAESKQATILSLVENVVSECNCGVISQHSFSCNLKLFLESQNYNTCLNKKISIDSNGLIKNCPSMSNNFGNHREVSLDNVINNPNFKKLWKKHKDLIHVCKDCEFRYMCTDCRVFIKDSKDIYSQPAKCSYNPYIAKWEGEEGYYTVEEYLNQN